ncbi:hypothetical protein [Pseudoclavibacter sp. VKM Ac-2867]|uniref:hypothetical protein n=1 Tax=Pseudoclavibacter sp. VKM Ac-2867 TaxID=2783829 RepID=UPI00188B18E5|nr:hypothetical protein [Pseudoclavibacter sp. VKM Ac-2867]MBF4459410.1 hypothetical protein [Pseudoclavibacter sp. VKM Ac-2867]
MKRAKTRDWTKADIDDIAAESLAHFVEQLWKKQLEREPKDRVPLNLHRALREHAGLIGLQIPRASQLLKFGEQKVDHRDVTASWILRQSELAFQEEHHRPMSAAEREREAARIREVDFGKHKPTVEFHRRQTNVSTNTLVGTSPEGSNIEMGELLESPPMFSAPQSFANDSEGLAQAESFEGAEGEYELYKAAKESARLSAKARGEAWDPKAWTASNWDGDQVVKPTARNQGIDADDAWNLLASVTGAPAVTAQSLPHEQAKASGVVVQQYDGGVAGLAGAINDGSASEADTDAFYAPFGGTTSKSLRELRTIASAFIAQPKYADRLYASALGTARMPEPETD